MTTINTNAFLRAFDNTQTARNTRGADRLIPNAVAVSHEDYTLANRPRRRHLSEDQRKAIFAKKRAERMSQVNQPPYVPRGTDEAASRKKKLGTRNVRPRAQPTGHRPGGAREAPPESDEFYQPPPDATLPPPEPPQMPSPPADGRAPDPGTWDRPLDHINAPTGYKWVLRTIGGKDHQLLVPTNPGGGPIPVRPGLLGRRRGSAHYYQMPQPNPRRRMPPGLQSPGPMPTPGQPRTPNRDEVIGPGGPPGSHRRINPGLPYPGRATTYYQANRSRNDGFVDDEQRKAFFASRGGGGGGSGGGAGSSSKRSRSASPGAKSKKVRDALKASRRTSNPLRSSGAFSGNQEDQYTTLPDGREIITGGAQLPTPEHPQTVAQLRAALQRAVYEDEQQAAYEMHVQQQRAWREAGFDTEPIADPRNPDTSGHSWDQPIAERNRRRREQREQEQAHAQRVMDRMQGQRGNDAQNNVRNPPVGYDLSQHAPALAAGGHYYNNRRTAMSSTRQLIANAIRVSREEYPVANRAPGNPHSKFEDDDQRKAFFASKRGGGGGGSAGGSAGENKNKTRKKSRKGLGGKNAKGAPGSGGALDPDTERIIQGGPHSDETSISRESGIRERRNGEELTLQPPPGMVYNMQAPPPGTVWAYQPNGQRIAITQDQAQHIRAGDSIIAPATPPQVRPPDAEYEVYPQPVRKPGTRVQQPTPPKYNPDPWTGGQRPLIPIRP